MELQLNGKNALVLGSSSGIGKAVASAFIQEGVCTAICARNKEKLLKTSSEIGAEFAHVCDLSEKGSGKQLVETVQKHLGGIDILVCNTGGPHKGAFTEISEEQWIHDFRSVWMSVVDTINYVIPFMKQNNWGRIILITSVAAKEPILGLTTSNGLRAGLLGLTKSISNEIAKDGITINALMPGYTATDRLRDLNIPENEITSQIPARRLGRPDELADLATFLASPRASYITGQIIACDGGYLRGY